MRITIFLALFMALIGCASKEERAPKEIERNAAAQTPAPKLIWTARADKTIAEFGLSSLFSAIAVAPEGDRLVSGDWDGRVLLWDTASGKLEREFIGHFDKVTAVAFGDDGATIFSASADRTIRAWDAASGGQIRLFSGHFKPIAAIAVSADTLVSADVGGVIRIWNAKTGRLIRQIADGRFAISAIVAAQDRVIRCGADGLIKIYSLKNGKVIKTLKGHKGRVYTIAAANGEIYSGGADGTIRVWNLASGAQKAVLRAPAPVRAIAVKNGLLASGGDDMIARFWDLASAKETHSFQTNAGGINALEFKGNLIVSASSKLQLFSAIDPNKISFDEIVKKADILAARNGDGGAPREYANEKRLAALEKALSIYWGDPRLTDLVYSDENQSVSGFIRSLYGDFSRQIEFQIAQDDAFELFYNPSYDPSAAFTIQSGALVLEEITIKDAWGERTLAKIIDGEIAPPLVLTPLDSGGAGL